MTTDHGHYLGDQRLYGKMGHPLLPPVLDVPILLRHPGGLKAGRTDSSLVQHQDIPATILDACGVEAVLRSSTARASWEPSAGARRRASTP